MEMDKKTVIKVKLYKTKPKTEIDTKTSFSEATALNTTQKEFFFHGSMTIVQLCL